MFRVRMPDGTCVTYDDGGYLEWGTTCHRIYTKNGGDFIALAPLQAIVEAHNPCLIERPWGNMTAESAAGILANYGAIRRAKPSDLAEIKYLLKWFNRQTGRWQD